MVNYSADRSGPGNPFSVILYSIHRRAQGPRDTFASGESHIVGIAGAQRQLEQLVELPSDLGRLVGVRAEGDRHSMGMHDLQDLQAGVDLTYRPAQPGSVQLDSDIAFRQRRRHFVE